MLSNHKERQAREIPKLIDLSYKVLVKTGLFAIDLPANATSTYQQQVSTVIEQMVNEKLLPDLLQALIDDDVETVKEILDANPELLLLEPSKGLVIKCKYSWQAFPAKKPLQMALERQNLEMIESVLPYFNKVENGIAEALVQWKVLEISDFTYITSWSETWDGITENLVEKKQERLKILRENLMQGSFPEVSSKTQVSI